MTQRKDKAAMNHTNDTINLSRTTLSALREDADIWYRLHVLLYDLGNVGSDPLSQKRLSSTTHALYISEPYFTASEATMIRTALIDDAADAETTSVQSASSPKDTCTSSKATIIEEAIHSRLAGFFDKRKASGDSRPCGPHDMVPIYVSILGIQKEEIKDERFLSRLRRSGLGDALSKKGFGANGKGESGGKGRKKGGKGK